MNNNTRKQINEYLGTLANIINELETLAANEYEKYENLSEGLQESERGENILNAADSLEEAVSMLEEAIDSLKNAIK